eukprot:281596_1
MQRIILRKRRWFGVILACIILIINVKWFQTMSFHVVIMPTKMDPNSVKSYPRVLINLGAWKCGTTTMEMKINYFIENLSYYLPFKHDNIRRYVYWSECYLQIFKYVYWQYFKNAKQCDFDEYLETGFYKSYGIDPQNESINIKKYIFIEKSGTYFTQYMAAHSLAYYSVQKQTKIYLYVLVRNPIKRLWSNYWMAYIKYRHLRRGTSDITNYHIHNVLNKIEKDVAAIPYKYPSFKKILKLLTIPIYNENTNITEQEKQISNLFETLQRSKCLCLIFQIQSNHVIIQLFYLGIMHSMIMKYLKIDLKLFKRNIF